MKRFLAIPGAAGGAIAIIAGAALTACSAAEAREPEVQRVSVEATRTGFVPDTVRLAAGTPAELIFTRTTATGCAGQVHIPDLGVDRTTLPQGEPVTIALEGAEPGSYEFRCGMDMLRGVIIVTPAAAR